MTSNQDMNLRRVDVWGREGGYAKLDAELLPEDAGMACMRAPSVLTINTNIFIGTLSFVALEQNSVFHRAQPCQENEKESRHPLCQIE